MRQRQNGKARLASNTPAPSRLRGACRGPPGCARGPTATLCLGRGSILSVPSPAGIPCLQASGGHCHLTTIVPSSVPSKSKLLPSGFAQLQARKAQSGGRCLSIHLAGQTCRGGREHTEKAPVSSLHVSGPFGARTGPVCYSEFHCSAALGPGAVSCGQQGLSLMRHLEILSWEQKIR